MIESPGFLGLFLFAAILAASPGLARKMSPHFACKLLGKRCAATLEAEDLRPEA